MPADVLIAGAGIVGASIAWRLAQAGLLVEVFDASRFGGEASWASAGMLAPGAEIAGPGPWSTLALESLARYPDFVQELAAETGVPIDYRPCGALELALNESEWIALGKRATRQAALGIRSEPLTPARAAALVPGVAPAALVGARFYPRDALVNPRDILGALCRALTARSVTIHESIPISAIRVSSAGIEVVTPTGSMAARAAVIAAGAWSSAIRLEVDSVARPIPAAFPVRGHLLGWRLPPGSLGPIVRHDHTYLLQRSSGFTVAGSSEERVTFARGPDVAIAADLLARARALVPTLLHAEPAETWTGFRPATHSGTPVIERLAEAPVWLAYGHYRNGILLAPATSRLVAGEVVAFLSAS